MAITLLDNETPESPTSIVSSGNVDTPVSGINNLKDPYEGRSLLQKKLIQDDIKLARDTIKWRQGERKKLDHNALNFEKWLPEVPKEHRVRSLIQGVMDAEMDMNPASVTSYETARVMLDRQVFGGDGSADDDAIFMKIQGRAKETKEKLEFYGKLEDEATLSALMGDDPYLKRLNPKFLFDPVFKKEKARSLQVWKDTISGIEEEYGDILPDVRKLWKMVDQDEPDLYKVADIIFKMDDDELDSAARILGKLQELQGSISSDRGVLGNVGEQSGRDKERTGSGLKGAAIGFFSNFAQQLLEEGDERTATQKLLEKGEDRSESLNEAAIEGEKGRQENLDRSERFLAEIRRFRDQRDPIVKVSKEGSFLGHVEGAAYAIPGVGMTIAASAISLVGPFNTIAMLQQSAEDNYYLSAVDAGLPRGEARQVVKEVAPAIVALQYLPERFGIGAITRKLPGLNKVLGKLPSAMQGRFARILAGTTARGVAETTTEEIQAILAEFGNDILHGLKEDIPEGDWDAHWANFGGRNLETFLSIAPYSGLSAARHDSGLGKAVEVGKKASRDQLLASGYKSEDVDAFQSAETPLAQRSSFNKMLSNQDPKTEEAKQAVGRVIENRKATIAAHRKLLEAGTILGVRMTKDSSSYEVYDTESGEAVTTVETPAEASQIVYGAIGARDRAIQNHVDALTSKLQAARMIVDETGVTQEIEDTKWLTTEEAGRLFEGTDERIAEEVELLEQVEGGSGEVSRAVFDTVTGVNIPAGTYGRINEVTKTFMGSSISTLIHEKSHSVRRKLMANGEFTNKEQIAFFRKLNEVLKGKKTKDSIAKDGTVIKGRSLRFSGFDGETVTETAIDEAWAQFSEVMLLKSKNGKKSTMRELLNANLSAMVGDGTPGASKFKAFIRAMRDWLGLNLGRAAAIDKALRDGKLDAAEMEKFRAAVMGETIQGQFENEVIETHKENFVPTENLPFSIGSTEVTPNADTRTFPTKDGGVVGPATFSISAFHGTPHKVGRFSTDRIGTGEGAQVYGWGLYFAESRKVGEQYSTTLASEGFDIIGVFDGKTVRQSDPLPPDELMGVNEFRAFRWLAQGSFEEAQEKVASLNVSEAAKNAQLEAIKNLSGRVSGPPTGNLYTVNLKVEPEELLDWDKPLSKQSEAVKAGLVKVTGAKETWKVTGSGGGVLFLPIDTKEEYLENHRKNGSRVEKSNQADGILGRGEQIYERISNSYQAGERGPMTTSKDLYDAGIKGIRYLDGNSRGSGEGSYNYVIFNDADIEILEENGQPVNLSEGMKAAFSISPAQDKEYLAAVEAGDLETAQEMVDSKIEKSPYLTRVKRGDGKAFEVFDKSRRGESTKAASAKKAFFFTDEYSPAQTFASMAANNEAEVYMRDEQEQFIAEENSAWKDAEADILAYANDSKTDTDIAEFINALNETKDTREPMVAGMAEQNNYFGSENVKRWVNAYGSIISESSPEWLTYRQDTKKKLGMEDGGIVRDFVLNLNNYNEIDYKGKSSRGGEITYADAIDKAEAEGKDGVILRNTRDAGEVINIYAVFEPNQIKSADPVTYDESGNVVPLSERFNENDDRISFSISINYLKEDPRFDELRDEGKVRVGVSVDEFDGKHVLLHSPDNAFAGSVMFDGEEIVRGKGGAYYPVLFADDNYFWASTKAGATSLVAALNRIGKKNGGKVLMALTSSPVEKLFSSSTMSRGTVNFFTALTKNPRKNGLTKSEFNKILVEASKFQTVKKIKVHKRNKDGEIIETVTKEKVEKFTNPLVASHGLEGNLELMNEMLSPESHIFSVRKAFIDRLAALVSEHYKNKPDQAKVVADLLLGKSNKHAKKDIRKGKLSKASILQALGDTFTEPFLKDFQAHGNGKVYAVVEVNGEVEAIASENHESYPFAIVPKNKEEVVSVSVLSDAHTWEDVVSPEKGSKPFEEWVTNEKGEKKLRDNRKSLFPTSGVSTDSLLFDTTKKDKNKGNKLSFSISPAQDKEYLAAVEAGDMETSQEMVDEAAKNAGYDVGPVYHGSPRTGKFTIFDSSKGKSFGGVNNIGVWFTSAKGQAAKFAEYYKLDGDKILGTESGEVFSTYLKTGRVWEAGSLENFFRVVLGRSGKDQLGEIKPEDVPTLREYFRNSGVDAVRIEDTKRDALDGDFDTGVYYLTFNPNQIKSADPVTYDESGNVVLLSERFNEKDDRISFSLGQSAMVNDVISDVTSRVRDPEARADIFENIILNVDQLRRDTDKPIFGGTVTQKAIVDPREMKSLKKEAGMREALRYDELEMALDSEMRTLGSDLPVSVRDMPAHSVLIDGGYKLTTKKKAVKDGRMSETDGDFDGSDGLHPSIFGGDTMPDVAAQALAGEQVNGQTLLNEGTAQELFEVLANEWAEVQRNREMNKDAKAAIVKAKKQAKAESNAWLQERIAEQKRDYNPMARLRRSLAMLDAIMMALPIELRGKIGGFVQISKLNTEEKRLEFLKDRLDKIDNVVESWVKNNLLKDITKVRGQAKATRKGGKKPKGKLGAEGHRFFDRVENVADLSKEDIEKEEAYLFTEIAKPDGDGARSRIDLAEDLQILQVFGGLNRKNAQELAAASKLAHETYRTKRNQWRVLEENRLGQLKVLVEETIDALGNPDIAAIQKGNEVESDRKEAIKALKSVDWTILSFSEVMERLFGRDHPLAARWSKAVRQAMGARTTAITQGHRRWKKATEEATGKKGRAAQLEVWEMQTKQTIKAAPMKDEKTTVKVPIKTFLQSESRKSLGLTKEEEIDIQDQIDNLKKGSQKKYISIERVKVVPEREANFTDSQAIYLTMLFSQEGYKATMRKHGFGETFQTQLEEGMSDAAKSIREHLKEEYAENYEPLRKIFARMFGMDLPQIKGYTPGKFYSQGDDLTMDVTGSGFVEGGLMTGFLADRKSHSAEPRIESAFSVYFAHLNQTEHWKALAEVSREIRGVFGNPKVKKALKAKNERAAFAVGEWLKAIDGNGFNNPKSNKVFEWLISTQAKLALAWKVSTIAKNFFGASVNAGFKVPLGDFIKGYGRLMNGKIDFRAMMDSELIQQRLDGGFSPEARAAINEDLGGKPTRGNQFVMMGMDVIGKADALGTAMGAAITYDYHYRMLLKEMGPEQAHDLAMDEAAEAIARTAQPVNVTDRSLMELQLTGLGKIAFIFASEARQKSAMWTQAWARTLTGKADKRDYRVLVMAHFVVAPLMHGITSALRDARNDDDDELFDEKNWGAGGWIRSVLTGPISGLPLLREIGDGFNSDDSGPLSRISNAGSSSIDLLQAIFGDEDPKKEEIEWYERKITSVLQAFGATSAVSSSVFDQMFDFIDNIGGKD
jgi:hypothetical protein